MCRPQNPAPRDPQGGPPGETETRAEAGLCRLPSPGQAGCPLGGGCGCPEVPRFPASRSLILQSSLPVILSFIPQGCSVLAWARQGPGLGVARREAPRPGERVGDPLPVRGSAGSRPREAMFWWAKHLVGRWVLGKVPGPPLGPVALISGCSPEALERGHVRCE